MRLTCSRSRTLRRSWPVLLGFAAAVGLAAGLLRAPVVQAAGFSDTASSPYHLQIEVLNLLGVVRGLPDGSSTRMTRSAASSSPRWCVSHLDSAADGRGCLRTIGERAEVALVVRAVQAGAMRSAPEMATQPSGRCLRTAVAHSRFAPSAAPRRTEAPMPLAQHRGFRRF